MCQPFVKNVRFKTYIILVLTMIESNVYRPVDLTTDNVVEAAQSVANTALNKLATVKNPELQAGPEVRKITLQSESDPNTVFQIIKRDTPHVDNGQLWIHKVTSETDESGITRPKHMYVELPRSGEVTVDNIAHLTKKKPRDEVAKDLTELAAQLRQAQQVAHSKFEMPRKSYRIHKEKSTLPTRIVEVANPRVVVDLFERARKTAASRRKPQKAAA